MGFTAIAFTYAIEIKTYLSPINVSIMSQGELVSQAEKDCHNSLGLWYYHSKAGPILINYGNLMLLVSKIQTAAIINDSMTFIYYNPPGIEEKELSLI